MSDGGNVPKARSWVPHFCGHCPNVHLIFFDAGNAPMCEATFSAEQCRRLERLIRAQDPNFREIRSDET